jgi:hypothetical protein
MADYDPQQDFPPQLNSMVSTPVLRDSEEPGQSRDKSGSSQSLGTAA